ncbi:regulatory protein, LysR:LysR, substrate-binding [Acetobacter pomorum]|nr:regulatory protein, LysR:LysR, substrate-binding [Acetobacter pomorum]
MADLQHLREHTLVRINCFIRNKGGLIVDPICERFIIAGRRIDSELKNLVSCQ